jgi:regulator of replication initiation timing
VGESPQHLVSTVRSYGLSAKKVLQVQDLYEERRHNLCPLGVLHTNLQVLLMQMSRWRAQIHSPMEENTCRVLTMRIHQYLYGEQRHYPCPLGVLFTNLQVSLMQMSRWRAQIRSPMEENPCRGPMMRIHQSRLRVDKDNPPTGQVQKATNQSKDHEQRTGSATDTKLGTYLYGILILCGLVIHDQTERLRRKYGYKAGDGINPIKVHGLVLV